MLKSVISPLQKAKAMAVGGMGMISTANCGSSPEHCMDATLSDQHGEELDMHGSLHFLPAQVLTVMQRAQLCLACQTQRSQKRNRSFSWCDLMSLNVCA